MENEYLQIFLNLSAVLLVIFVLVYLLKKLTVTKYSKNKHIKIINIVPVGSKEKVILMNVNNTMLLVGATPNHIETLYVFNESPEPVLQTEKDKEFPRNEVMVSER